MSGSRCWKDILKYVIGATILGLLTGIVNNYITTVKHDVRITDISKQVDDISDRVDDLERANFGYSRGKKK